MSSTNGEKAIATLQQIKEAIVQLKEWNAQQ